MRKVELVIVGAGPAGICAAIEAAKSNVQVTLLSETPKVGGQIYGRLADGFLIRNDSRLGKDYVRGTKLVDEFQRHRGKIELIEDALVWGIYSSNEVTFLHNGKNEVLKPQKLILAEGAYDRPIPFPGWTLPGIFTAGGALKIVKIEKVLPGKRILLAGTGPLQLVLATQLVQVGAEVVAILEASSFNGLWKYLPRFWGQWGLLRDGLGYLWELWKAKIPILTSHAIIEARGDEEVNGAVYAKVNRDWKPIPGTEKRIEVDTVCVGYGLIPSTRLSRLCGCEHRYNPYLGGWVACHDEYMELTSPGVFVAGDCAGIEGGLVAAEEGRLAAIRASQELGHITQKEARRRCLPVFKRLRGLRKFESVLNEVSVIRRGLFTQITDDTIICRCEEVTAGDIRQVVRKGTTDMNEIRKLTRAGMGLCQGRMCESIIAEIVSMETKQPIEETGYFTLQAPIKPIPFSSFI